MCGLPGSSAYFSRARFEILSTCYHRGPPTFFITITAAGDGIEFPDLGGKFGSPL